MAANRGGAERGVRDLADGSVRRMRQLRPVPELGSRRRVRLRWTVVYLKQTGEIQVAQMRVHRVFKGHLPPHIEVYHRPNIEMAPIRTGQRYVMPITRMNPSLTGGIPRRPFLERTDDPSLVWATAGCGGELRHILKQRGQLDGFGPGWPPTR
jgi:hypothetical protein